MQVFPGFRVNQEYCLNIKYKQKKEKNMFTLCFLILALIVLGITACRWGANSADGINSPEWQQRQDWPGFH